MYLSEAHHTLSFGSYVPAYHGMSDNNFKFYEDRFHVQVQMTVFNGRLEKVSPPSARLKCA